MLPWRDAHLWKTLCLRNIFIQFGRRGYQTFFLNFIFLFFLPASQPCTLSWQLSNTFQLQDLSVSVCVAFLWITKYTDPENNSISNPESESCLPHTELMENNCSSWVANSKAINLSSSPNNDAEKGGIGHSHFDQCNPNMLSLALSGRAGHFTGPYQSKNVSTGLVT